MQLAEFATADCQGLVLAHRQNFADGSISKRYPIKRGSSGRIWRGWHRHINLCLP